MEYRILENAPLTPNVYRLRLRGDASMLRSPGQFCQVRVPGFYLRRPISVCDWDAEGMTLIYKVVGQGTDALSKANIGDALDILNGLGNGFDVTVGGQRPLVVGGGVGAPPLYALTKHLLAAGKSPRVILGFNTKEEIFLQDDFAALGVPVTVTTADGSFGVRGFVTDALPKDGDSLFACGPLPMLRALTEKCPLPGQLSFEERMACGFGACMGCTHQTKNGYKRICKDGPVLRTEEVVW